MKNKIKIYCKFLFLSLFILYGYSISAQQKKVVFIIVDGIPPDVLENAQTPALDAIAKAGCYRRAHVGGEKGSYTETPTISAVGYNSLLTGTWVNKHNVWDNDIKEPNYNYWNIFRILKYQQPNKKIAVFSSWTDNRTRLVGDRLAEAGNIRVDYRFDSLELDTVSYPHDPAHRYMEKIDSAVSDHAAQSIRDIAPDLSWVYLEYTDDIGHMYGDSKEFINSVESMDSKIKKIWEAVQYRQKRFKEDWLLLVTTDHGRGEANGKNHGGQSERQRGTWIVSNKKFNDYAQYYKPAIVDLMPTIAVFMNLQMPKVIRQEVDGVALIGKVSVAKPVVNYLPGKLDIEWKALQQNGTVKIWLSTTNNFKTGANDKYILIGEIPLVTRHATIDVTTQPSSFYKIILEGVENSVNRWITIDSKK